MVRKSTGLPHFTPRRRPPGPVAVRRLPMIVCEQCGTTLVRVPGRLAGDILADHYITAHPIPHRP